MKNIMITMILGLVLAGFSACGSSSSSKKSVMLKQGSDVNVSVNEGSTLLDVSEYFENAKRYEIVNVADLNISLAGEILLEENILHNNITVATTTVYPIVIAASDDDNNSVEVTINLEVIDEADDQKVLVENIVFDKAILFGKDMLISLSASDDDGMELVEIDLLDSDDSSLYTRFVHANSGANSVDVNESFSDLPTGSYSFKITATGVGSGENQRSIYEEVVAFEVQADSPTTVNVPTLVSKTSSSVKVLLGTATDNDGVKNVLAKLFSDSALTNLVATDSNGSFTGLDSSTEYYVVTSLDALNLITSEYEEKKSAVLELTTDDISDAPTTISAPTLISKSTSSFSVNLNTLDDADGVRNLIAKVYSKSSLTSLISTSSTGSFTGLSSGVTFYVITVGETLDGATGVWQEKISTALSVTTNTDIDALTTISPPTLISKSTSSFSVNFDTLSDSDGVRNLEAKVYSDSILTTLVYTSSTGSFTSLDSNTTFYVITVGEALNGATGIWSEKVSTALSVITNNSAVNSAPVATDVSVNAGGNDTVTHNLNANISDAESADSVLTITVVSDPSHGALSWNGNEFTYEVTHGSTYGGDDSFTYKVTDPDNGVSSTKTVTILSTLDS